MNLLELNWRVCFIIALGSALLCFAISFQSVGLSQGLNIGDRALEEYRTQRGEELIFFSGEGFNTYDYVATEYGWLSILFGVIALASATQSLVRRPSLLYFTYSTIALSALLILYKLRGLIREKTFVEDFVFDVPRNLLLKLTIDYDWLLVVLTVSIIAALILPAIASLFNRRLLR